ncbi:MAG: DUF2029 domain-containing protein [Spirochaetales bacterium]|nr:DUF2029 domain-containing protein [Spirochaetales bacterium]
MRALTEVRAWLGRTEEFTSKEKTLWVLIVLLTLSFFYASGLKITAEKNPLQSFLHQSRSDFEDYLEAARDLKTGRDPYRREELETARDRSLALDVKDLLNPELWPEMQKLLRGMGRYLYPPFLAFLLLPLADIGYEKAAYLFQFLSCVSLGLAFWYFYHHSERPRLALGGILLATVLSFNFLLGNVDNGNIGFFLILLCGPGLGLSFSTRREFAWLGGALIGVAAVLKVAPVFLGLFLLAGRRFHALAGATTAGLLALALPALFLGMEQNVFLLESWYELLIKSFGQEAIVRPWLNNQSLSAAIGKLILPGADLKQASYGLPFFFSATNFPSRQEGEKIRLLVRILQTLVMLLPICFALIFLIRKKSVDLYHRRGLDFLWLILLVSLVASGVSWFHTFSILWIPLFLRAYLFLSGELLDSGEWFFAAVLFLFGFLFAILPASVREPLAIYSVFTWFCFIFLIHKSWKLARGI